MTTVASGTPIDSGLGLKEESPLPQKELAMLKALYEYKPPYMVEEIKKLCPGLYGPVTH